MTVLIILFHGVYVVTSYEGNDLVDQCLKSIICQKIMKSLLRTSVFLKHMYGMCEIKVNYDGMIDLRLLCLKMNQVNLGDKVRLLCTSILNH